MRVLVTGANGLIGLRLCELFERRGHDVLGVSRGERRSEWRFPYAPVELTVAEDVERAIRVHRAEVVLHPAAMTEPDRCERDPEAAWANNVTAVEHVARAARRVGAHLIHLSTDYVFDGRHGPYAEDAVPNPIGVYATTKHASEQAAAVLAPGCAIARTAVVYGHPPSARMNFGVWLWDSLRRGQPVRLFEDQWVSPSWADSVAEQLVELAERRLGGVWNVCGGEVVTRLEFGRAVCETFGFDPGLLVPVKVADAGLTAPRPVRAGLVADKARAQLQAKPLSIAESLRRFRDSIPREVRA